MCPGDPISITCTHNDDGFTTRWAVTGNSAATCVETVSHGVEIPPDETCGLFAITMISGASSFPNFTSTTMTNATAALNGAVVECFFSGAPTSLAGNVAINVLGEVNVSIVSQHT